MSFSLTRRHFASIGDERVRASLNESQARVHAMAMLHETLYQSGNLAGVDFAKYVSQLWSYLARTFSRTHEAISFQPQVDLPPLDIDKAVPCVLILKELLSNAIKYTFPGRYGLVRVECRKSDNSGFTLRVSDNGIGFTDADRSKAMDRGSLGLKLIDALCQQLDATYAWSGPGTVFTMTLE